MTRAAAISLDLVGRGGGRNDPVKVIKMSCQVLADRTLIGTSAIPEIAASDQ
jgi:hypothetical protein